MMKLFFIILLIAKVTTMESCIPKQKSYKSPEGYDLMHPEKFNMPDQLFEISGIAFNNRDPDTIFAIQDEAGKLFHWKLGDDAITHAKFGKAGDYEDVAILNGYAIVLRSNGALFSFPLSQINEKDIENTIEWKDLLPPGEYESLYADAANNQLYVLCKGCDVDKKNQVASGYIFSVSADGQLQQTGTYLLSYVGIEMKGNKKDQKFRPSAITKNPRTNEWYILSSVNKMLVITDKDWKIKETYDLNPSHFVQPEGIAFDKDYNLYISNEGDKLDEGNVQKFKFKSN